MYCPKCGIENPDTGKFCRKCGTDLSGVSEMLESPTGGLSRYNITGTGSPFGAHDGKRQKHSKNPDDIWAGGIRNTIYGLGFLVIALVLFLTNVAGGSSWWWAMLFPGFSMIASGIANLAKANRLENRLAAGGTRGDQAQMSGRNQNASLPPKQTAFVSPEIPDYKTGDLVPSSVVENTTRHLELDAEGETVTLPEDKTKSG